MEETWRLLAEFVEKGSEPAFRELVSRYIRLVYSTAVRLVGGDRHLAEDVTQIVFVDLSRNARKLSPDVMLGGWLHRDTCYVASKVMRGERRRQAREREAVFMNWPRADSDSNLQQAASVIDEAINLLGEEDRSAILLRFYEQRDFRSVGAAIGSNEDAARMRVNRAVGKLQAIFKRRGVTISVAALGTMLASEAVSAVPTGLAAAIATGVLTGSAAGVSSSAALKMLMITKLKTAVAAAVLIAGVGTPLVYQHQAQVKLREENKALQRQMSQQQNQNNELSQRLAQATGSQTLTKEQLNELMRLRNEIGRLRQLTNEMLRLREQNQRLATALGANANREAAERDATEEAKQMAIAKMNDAKALCLGAILYAEEHQGQMPTTYDQISNALLKILKTQNVTMTGTNQFELVYSGSLKELTNFMSTILLREREPSFVNGKWVRAYGFADGHSEYHTGQADGNFEQWEQQHMAPTNR